jgi:hypothetical protein
MMSRLKLLYPFLFAIIPILNVVSRNPGYATVSDITAVLAFVLVGCGLLYVLLAVLVRWPRPIISWIVFLIVVWFYAGVPLALTAREIGGRALWPALMLIPAGATVALGWWLTLRPRLLERTSTFFTLTGLFLVGWLSARVVADQVRAGSAIRHSTLVSTLARPVPVTRKGNPPAPEAGRDIYLIVLDEYANSSVLRDRFNFDNRLFEDSLRQLGFTIPKVVRSNYAHTILSLPSLLNFSHLTALTQELGSKAKDPTLPDYLLEHNRTAAFLKGEGYRFLLFPSQWWPATQHNTQADSEFEAWHGFSLGREFSRSHFRRSLNRLTVLSQVFRSTPHDAEHVQRTLAAIKKVTTLPEPTFVFAHIMSPHYPYVLEATCRSVPEHATIRKRTAYVNQLQCLNRLVLDVVSTLLRESRIPPIILLQGDHGTSTLNFSWASSAAAVSAAQARERFGAFGAYYLPDDGGRLFRDTVTVVNVFQKVLSHYYGAEVAPAPDDLYMSLERAPYDFARVEPRSLRPAGTSAKPPM